MLLIHVFIPLPLRIACFLLLICTCCLIPVGIVLICVFHNRSILYLFSSNFMPSGRYPLTIPIFNRLWIPFQLSDREKWIKFPPIEKSTCKDNQQTFNYFFGFKI